MASAMPLTAPERFTPGDTMLENNLFKNSGDDSHFHAFCRHARFRVRSARSSSRWDRKLSGAGQLIAMLTNGKIIYAGADNGQIPIASAASLAPTNLLPLLDRSLMGTGSSAGYLCSWHRKALQRLFILSDKGNLYA